MSIHYTTSTIHNSTPHNHWINSLAEAQDVADWAQEAWERFYVPETLHHSMRICSPMTGADVRVAVVTAAGHGCHGRGAVDWGELVLLGPKSREGES